MSGRFNLNDYVTVDERIDRFWEQYPHGAIRTEIVYTNNDGSSIGIRASVYKDWEHPNTNPDATGIAQELQGGANANKASWWENCETSAIGRALANMGMSISKQRPSREEMAKVRRYEDDDGNAAASPAPPRRVEAQRPALTPTPPTAPAQEQTAGDDGWTAAWTEARAQGIKDHAALAAFMGVPTGSKIDPAAVLRQLRGQSPPAPTREEPTQ